MLAAVRAHDSGLKTILIEKTGFFGGTSAVSGGGLWIPNNRDIQHRDSQEKALDYLQACTRGTADETRLAHFVTEAPRMAEYLVSDAGVPMRSLAEFPDYFSRLPGAAEGRVIAPLDLDGGVLGEELSRIRDGYSYLKLLGRISVSTQDALLLSTRSKGWRRRAFLIVARYWLDLSQRRRTMRDRRLSNGQALVGHLRRAMLDRNIPLLLNTKLVSLVGSEASVDGAVIERNGHSHTITVKRAIILASGGFESNQTMREKYLDSLGPPNASAAPRGMNMGEAIRAAEGIGGRFGDMGSAWKAPVMLMPSSEGNLELSIPFFWDRAAPGSLCVNIAGKRFVNETMPYDEFTAAMIADSADRESDASCWMIFDAACRYRSQIGPLMPSAMKPDRKLPREWKGTVYFRAASIAELAGQIDVPPEQLKRTITDFNAAAPTGKDELFDRGGSAFDRFFGDSRVGPNPTLAPIIEPPFYAIRLDPGDLGTKGGLATDTVGRVQHMNGGPIEGLYAAGNCAASIFGDYYPGPGGTLAPALTQAFLSAEHIGRDSSG